MLIGHYCQDIGMLGWLAQDWSELGRYNNTEKLGLPVCPLSPPRRGADTAPPPGGEAGESGVSWFTVTSPAARHTASRDSQWLGQSAVWIKTKHWFHAIHSSATNIVWIIHNICCCLCLHPVLAQSASSRDHSDRERIAGVTSHNRVTLLTRTLDYCGPAATA